MGVVLAFAVIAVDARFTRNWLFLASPAFARGQRMRDIWPLARHRRRRARLPPLLRILQLFHLPYHPPPTATTTTTTASRRFSRSLPSQSMCESRGISSSSRFLLLRDGSERGISDPQPAAADDEHDTLASSSCYNSSALHSIPPTPPPNTTTTAWGRFSRSLPSQRMLDSRN